MKQVFIIPLLCFIIMMSCDLEQNPIDYNHDECAFCKMKISDTRFGAELVTTKGKVYKFDSAECLLRTYISKEKPDYAMVLVTDYAKPRSFTNAAEATFLISENQPSPMGGNLSAYKSSEQANKVSIEKGGKLLTFEELLTEYSSLYK